MKTYKELEIGKVYRTTEEIEKETEVFQFIGHDRFGDPVVKPVSGMDCYHTNEDGLVEFYAWALEDESFYEQDIENEFKRVLGI